MRGNRETLLGVVLGIVALALLVAARQLFRQDSWLALVAGRQIWTSGIPHHDTLTALTAGRRWVDQQWLSQLGIYALDRLGGLRLVVVVHVALVTGSLAAAVAIGRRRGTPLAGMLVVLLVGLVLLLVPSLVVRTQPYAYPLFVATIALLSADSRAPSGRVYWTLPILVLWANVHGSAALGAALVVLRAITILVSAARGSGGERHGLKGGLLLLIAAPAALLATPYGLAAISYYHDTLLNPDFTRLVSEWHPVTDVRVAAVPFFLLAGTAVWSIGRHRGRLTPWERLALLVLTAGGITALRNIVWFELALLMLPVVVLGTGGEDAAARPRINQLLALGATGAVVVMLAITLSRSDHAFERSYPPNVLAAVDRATTGDPSLRVFADLHFADWLLWRRPQLRGRVAFDARLELQPAGELERLAKLLTATGIHWREPADGYGLVVLRPSEVGEAARGFRAERGARVLLDADDSLVIRRAG